MRPFAIQSRRSAFADLARNIEDAIKVRLRTWIQNQELNLIAAFVVFEAGTYAISQSRGIFPAVKLTLQSRHSVAQFRCATLAVGRRNGAEHRGGLRFLFRSLPGCRGGRIYSSSGPDCGRLGARS